MKNSKKTLALLLGAVCLLGAFTSCGTPPVSSAIESSEAESATSSSIVTPPSEELPEEKFTFEGHISEIMPRIDINSLDGKSDFATKPNRTNKWDYTDCTVSVSNCEEDEILTEVAAGVRVRGNYTANYEKKPFRIKFEKKQSMLSLNEGAKCKSWVLLANYKDYSLLRNSAAFYLGNRILGPDGYYCSDFRDVEVYINGVYWGVYLLAEQQQINKNRIDINEPEEDYAGTDIGYMFEYNQYWKEEAALEQFNIDYNNDAPLTRYNGTTVKPSANDKNPGYSIKNDVYDGAQRDFAQAYLSNVYTVCYKATYNDEAWVFNDTFTAISKDESITPIEAVEKVVDLQSWVDCYIVQEICCDFDLNRSNWLMNVNLSADGDKILRVEAPWDYDSALANRPALESGEGLYAANEANPWILLFVNEEWFIDMVKDKWQKIIEDNVFSDCVDFLTKNSNAYQSYYTENYDKWKNFGHSSIVSQFCARAKACKTQQEAFDWLIEWLCIRACSMDTYFGDGSLTFA